MSRAKKFFALTLITYSIIDGISSEIVLGQDGGYSNIIIAISSKLDSSEITPIVQNLEKLYTDGSKALFTATKGKFYLKHILVAVGVVPQNIESKYTHKVGFLSFDEADIRIDLPHPYHGDSPYTLQSRTCGRAGQYTHLTPAFVQDQNSPVAIKAKELVRQWVRLRYGAFDEFGYIGDELYPAFYVNGRAVPTGCSNVPVDGENIDRVNSTTCDVEYPTNSDIKYCTFVPFEEENVNVTSSLMYLSNLPNVESLCGDEDHRHVVEAPTKHNFLCDHKSVWDVLKSTDDYAHLKAGKNSKRKFDELPKIKVELVKPSSSNAQGQVDFIMAIDVSFNDKKDITIVSEAVRLMLTQNWNPGKVTLLTFHEQIVSEGPLKDVNDIKSSNTANTKSVLNAIQNAKCLQNATGNSLILITSGNVNHSDMIAIEKILQQKHIKLFLIIYPATPDTINRKWFDVASKVYMIEDGTNLESLGNLIIKLNDINNIINPDESKRCYMKKIWKEDSGQKQMLNETLPEDLHGITFITNENEELDIHCTKSQKKVSPSSGHGKYTYYKLTKLESSEISVQYREVLMLLYFKKSENINIYGWVELEQGLSRSNDSLLSIYGHLEMNYQPVIQANVIAKIYTHVNESYMRYSTVTLFDNGSTHPDITAQDGVYSNYVSTNIAENTIFTVVLVVESTYPLNSSFLALNRTWLGDSCCGSNVEIQGRKNINLPELEIILGTFMSPSNITNNIPAPRVTDLKITSFDSSHVMAMIWSGNRSLDYEVGCSGNITDVVLGEAAWTVASGAAEYEANKAMLTIDVSPLLNDTDTVYCAVRAVANDQLFSNKLSNVVHVFRERTFTTPVPERSSSFQTTHPTVTEFTTFPSATGVSSKSTASTLSSTLKTDSNSGGTSTSNSAPSATSTSAVLSSTEGMLSATLSTLSTKASPSSTPLPTDTVQGSHSVASFWNRSRQTVFISVAVIFGVLVLITSGILFRRFVNTKQVAVINTI